MSRGGEPQSLVDVIKEILPRDVAAQVLAIARDAAQPVSLEQLRELPSTATLLERLDIMDRAQRDGRLNPVQLRDLRQRMKKAAAEADLGLQRDEIQALRPAGCTCLGTGQRSFDERWKDKDGLRWCSCSDGQQARREFDEYLRIQRDGADVERAYIRSRLELPRTDLAFESYQPDQDSTPTYTAIKHWADRGPAWVGDGASIWLYGQSSIGKTGLAICALEHRCMSNRESGWFVTAGRLKTLAQAEMDKAADELVGRDGKQRESSLERAAHVRVLVLDDIGKDKPSDWWEEQLAALLTERFTGNRPTIFTSNDGLLGLSDRIGAYLVERMMEMCDNGSLVLQLKGRNRRTKGA